jgi:hypothetical protein
MCMHPLTSVRQDGVQEANESPEFLSTIIANVDQSSQVVCQSCHASNKAEFNFCQACGSRLTKDSALQDATTEVAAAISQSPLTQNYGPDPRRTAPATAAILRCPKCMNEALPGSRFCNLCGTPLGADQSAFPGSAKFRLRLIVDCEATDEVYHLRDITVVGRVNGDINFPYDDFMSSRHATIRCEGERLFLKDNGSRNGTLIKIDDETELKSGDVFMVGKQLFKVEFND